MSHSIHKISSGSTGPVVVKGELWFLESIEKRLGLKNKMILKKSPIGHLFEIPFLKVQSHLLAVLLKNLDSSPKKQKTLSFRVNSRSVEFGADDFALITGLRYGDLNMKDPIVSAIHIEMFNSKKRIKFNEIRTKFLHECSVDGNSVESLKLALLYIVYGFLMTRDWNVADIDLKFLHLVDDTEAFMNYPWGTVVYNFLVQEMHAAATKIRSNSSPDIVLHGFAAALQIWVYEIFPTIAREFANKLEWRGELSPRMLRWSTARCPDRSMVEPVFNLNGKIEMIPIRKTMDERASLRSIKVVRRVSPKTVPLVQSKKPLCRRLEYVDFAAADIEKNKLRPSLKAKVRKLDEMNEVRRSPRLAKEHPFEPKKAIEKKNKKVIPPATSSTLKPECVIEEQGSNELLLKLDEVLSTLTDVKCLVNNNSEKLDEMQKAICGLQRRRRHATEKDYSPKVQGKLQTVKGKYPSINKRPRFEENKKAEQMHMGKGNALSMFDPSHAGHCSTEMAPFLDWYTDMKALWDEKIELPTIVVTRSWFDDIWFTNRRLYNEHIDALTTLVKINEGKYPEKFLYGWTLLEQACWGPLTTFQIEDAMDLLMPYVRGEYPIVGGIPWHHADRIMGVGHVLGQHWVVYEVNLYQQRIVIYDSMSDCAPKDQVLSEFESVARAIPALCEEGEVWKRKGWNARSMKRCWEVVYYPNPPQQTNNDDCGIMCIKYIECLASGNPVSAINPARCGFFRQIMCGQLFHNRKQLIEGVPARGS